MTQGGLLILFTKVLKPIRMKGFMVYGVNVEHYLRINFAGFINIIDAPA